MYLFARLHFASSLFLENNLFTSFNTNQLGTFCAVKHSILKFHLQIDTSSVQAEEVWTGISYAVAAAMIQEVR